MEASLCLYFNAVRQAGKLRIQRFYALFWPDRELNLCLQFQQQTFTLLWAPISLVSLGDNSPPSSTTEKRFQIDFLQTYSVCLIIGLSAVGTCFACGSLIFNLIYKNYK